MFYLCKKILTERYGCVIISKSSYWKFEREESMVPAQRRQFVIRKRLAWPIRKTTHNFEFEWLCLHSAQCLKEQRWSTVAASVVSTGAIGPSVHPLDETSADLSLSSQRVRLMLITSTQESVSRSCWVVFFFCLSLPDRNLETSVRIHFQVRRDRLDVTDGIEYKGRY